MKSEVKYRDTFSWGTCVLLTKNLKVYYLCRILGAGLAQLLISRVEISMCVRPAPWILCGWHQFWFFFLGQFPWKTSRVDNGWSSQSDRIESLIKSIQDNQTLVTKEDNDHYRITTVYPGQYCVDVAQNSNNGILEGPLLIQCNSMTFSVGQITKCCPKKSILGSERRNCVSINDERDHSQTMLTIFVEGYNATKY